MTNTFRKQGDTLDVTAPADVVSGQFIQVGQLSGVVVASGLSGSIVQIKRTGEHATAVAATAETWTEGQLAYFDGTNFSNVSAVGKLLVGFTRAKAAGTVNSHVVLDGIARADV